MKEKTAESKFKDDLMKVGAILKMRHIAILESHIPPNFSSNNQTYAEATFIPLNREVLEDLVSYINKKTLEFLSSMSLRPIDDETNNRYTLVICPYSGLKQPKDIQSKKPYLLEETEKFLAHIPRIIRDYHMKYPHQ
jgi:hypothetical protein